MKIFQQSFNDHIRENNLPKEQFTKDFYASDTSTSTKLTRVLDIPQLAIKNLLQNYSKCFVPNNIHLQACSVSTCNINIYCNF